MRDPRSIEDALKGQKFDYLIFKGIREYVHRDNGSFEAFVRHAAEHYTTGNSVFVVSFASDCNLGYDGEIADVLESLGYDEVVLGIGARLDYPFEHEEIDVPGNTETTNLGVPELAVKGEFNSLIPVGDFGFFRKNG